MMKFYDKYKKFLIAIVIVGVVISVYNYDKITAKVIKKLPVSVENYLAEQYLPDKFWLHRTDSVEKQYEFANKYQGIEFDIIYYEAENAFENSHDKKDLNKYNLEKQLRAYQDIGLPKGIWLDFKNLTENNKFAAKNTLDNIMTKYNIDKKLVWLESGNWQALKIFHDDGYRTSYYLPYYKLDKMTAAEIENARKLTKKIAFSGSVDAVSFYGGYYDFVNSVELPPRTELLTWLDGYAWYEVMLRKDCEKIKNDRRIQVILVKDRGNYHR